MAITTFTMRDAAGDVHSFLVDEIDLGGGNIFMLPLTKFTVGAADEQGSPVSAADPMPVDDGEATPRKTDSWTSDKDDVIQSGVSFLGMLIYNPNTEKVFVQVFDSADASAVTLGTTANEFWVPVRPNGFTSYVPPKRVAFATGIVIGQTTEPDGAIGPTSDLNVVTFTGDL